jgi:S1-C subfamily serine protease
LTAIFPHLRSRQPASLRPSIPRGSLLHTVLAIAPLIATPVVSNCEESPRLTPLVKVIQEIEPAVISLFVPTDEQNRFATGSGTIIHPEGFVLTNNHVLPRSNGYAIFRGKAVRFAVIGRLPEKDLALLKLRDVSTPLPTVPLGHSHDVLNGESVVVAGNPGGRGVVFTAGIVSSKSVLLDAPNALAMTQFSDNRRDNFIQFDAESNRGNSGGPLVNMEGELIGIVSALIPQEQNIGFAIPVDRVREKFERVLDPQLIHQKSLGIQLSAGADQAIITEILAGSTAAKAGLQVGDKILSVNGLPLRAGADWWLALQQHLPSGNPLDVLTQRGETRIPVNLTPDKYPPLEPVTLDNAKPGLQYSLFQGHYNLLPDFGTLTAANSEVASIVDLEKICPDQMEDFALRLSGYFKLDKPGLYRLTIVSDDGSRVLLHNQLFIDNDGNHPPMPASRMLRAKAGLHPITIEYYQGTGRKLLTLSLESLSDKDGEMVELQLFHEATPTP